ncbi:kelch-like protein 26 [Glandiceps talaboti]
MVFIDTGRLICVVLLQRTNTQFKMAASRTVDKKTLDFCHSNEFKGHILQSLYEQSREGRFCDVILKLSGQDFPAHGCVLAANSHAFNERLRQQQVSCGAERNNRDVTTIELNNTGQNSKVTPAVFAKVLQFMYTGILDISEDDIIHVDDIREASQLLQLSGMQEPFQELHTTRVYTSLCQQRVVGEFCDVTMLVDGQSYVAHRCLLAAYSPYFDAMFGSDMSEKNKREIEFPSLTCRQADFLLEYLYNQNVRLTIENLEDCLEVADFFHIPQMKDKCGEFLSSILDCTNCIRYRTLAETFSVHKAYREAKKFIERYFVDVIRADEVLLLSVEELMQLITANDNVVEVVRKGKVIETESCVFDMVLRWIEESERARKRYLHKLLSGIRLQMITSSSEREKILNCPIIQGNSESLQMVFKAFQSTPGEVLGDRNLLPRRGQMMDMISVVGATGSMMSSKMTSYSVDDDKWILLLEIPISLQYAAAVFYQNRLYLSGGLLIKYRHRGHFGSATEISKSLYCYDPMLHHWTRLPDMLECRYHHQLVACNNGLYVIGGRFSIGDVATDAQCYNLENSEWKFTSPPKRPAMFRNEFLTHTWNKNIYVLSIESLKTSGTIDMYNTLTGDWSILVFEGFAPKVSSKLLFCLPHPSLESSQIYVTDFHTVHHKFNLTNQEYGVMAKENTVMVPSSCQYIHNTTVVRNTVYVLGFRMWAYDVPMQRWNKLACYKGYFSKGECGLLQVPSQFVY